MGGLAEKNDLVQQGQESDNHKGQGQQSPHLQFIPQRLSQHGDVGVKKVPQFIILSAGAL
jgi:hypothetical protein